MISLISEVKCEVVKADIRPKINIRKFSFIENTVSRYLDTLDKGFKGADFSWLALVGCCYGWDKARILSNVKCFWFEWFLVCDYTII